MEWEETLIHPLQQQLKEQKTATKKLEEQLSKTETLVSNVPGGTEVSSAVIGKSTTFKIPTFDGTAPRELYHKQFEAAAAHNQWSNAEKTAAPTVHLKRVHSRYSQHCPRVTPSSTPHLLVVWSRDLNKNTLESLPPSIFQPSMELLHGSCTTNSSKLPLHTTNGVMQKRQQLQPCTSRG